MALAKRIKCTILFATETGRSEAFAKTSSTLFKHAFNVNVRKIHKSFLVKKLY